MSQPKRRGAVVTDSTAYLPAELVEQYDISVVPLTLIMGQETWLDGVEIDPPTFYQLLETSPHFPSTSQPNVATFQELFSKLAGEVEGIAAVLISSELSGTVDSAVQAAANLPNIPIEIVDTRATTMMLGFHVLAAARVAATGGDLEAVAGAAQALLGKTHIYFVVDTLEYLHRGGRIGGAAKLLGSALNLKPILEIKDGSIVAVTKVRTRRKAIQKVYALLEEQLAARKLISMGVVNIAAEKEAAKLRDELVARFNPPEMYLADISPVIGAHTGPGTVGVVWHAE